MTYYFEYAEGDDPMSAAMAATDAWEEEFYKYWDQPPLGAQPGYQEIEDHREAQEVFDGLREYCLRAPLIYQAMLTQRFPAELTSALMRFSPVPLAVTPGFDARRIFLLPDSYLVLQHIDLALMRDLLASVNRDSSESVRRYRLLLLSAFEHPISPIASQYYSRAARLFLLGLDLECVALCRSTLESALRYQLEESALTEAGIAKRHHDEFDLAGLIEGAFRLRIWNAREKQYATKIRLVGNSVLHPKDPEELDQVRSQADAQQRLADLAKLLRKLFPEE